MLKECGDFVNKKFDLVYVGHNLNKQTLNNFIKKQKINELTMKKGPKANLPPWFLELFDCHVSMSQFASVGECKPIHLKENVGAAINSSLLAEHITTNYVDKKSMEKVPVAIQQSIIEGYIVRYYKNITHG